MKAKQKTNDEWWLWQLNRQLAAYLYNPSQGQAARLHFFLAAYRYFTGQGQEVSRV